MAATMSEEEELRVMKLEFQWLLEKQVPSILRKVESVLKACDEKFNTKPQNRTDGGSEKPDKFLLKTPSIDVLKGYVTVNGDSIANAELKLKVPKIGPNGNIHTFIKEGLPWRLNQVQDAKNNLQMAIEKISEALSIETFTTGMQINEMMDELIGDISRGKASLSLPEKQTVPEIMSNGSLNAFKPSLPSEVVVNFHVNCHKLVFTIYVLNTLSASPPTAPQKPQLNSDRISSIFEHGGKWFEITNRFEVECVVSWLEDAFELIAIALQLCQQIKDKIGVFSRITEE